MRSRVYVTVGCPSVCPIDRYQQRRPAGLLLSAVQTGDQTIAAGAVLQSGIQFRRWHSAANAGIVTLRADGRDSTQYLL